MKITSYPKEFASHFVGVGGVVIHCEKVLLVKLLYGRAQNRWLIPGGFIEPGETLQEGVVREILEETNLKVKPAGIIGVRSMVRSRDKLTDIYCIIKCVLESDPNDIKPQPDEVADARWIPINELAINQDIHNYTKLIVSKALNRSPMILDNPLNENAKNRYDILKYEQFWV